MYQKESVMVQLCNVSQSLTYSESGCKLRSFVWESFIWDLEECNVPLDSCTNDVAVSEWTWGK